MEKIIFKSIGHSNIRYVISKDHYDMSNGNFYKSPGAYVGNTCFQYDTCGDGDVQHSPEWLVSAQELEDFMVSLALYISDNHSIDLLPVLDGLEPYGISADEIQFLYALKVRDNGKPMYINLKEMKKTTADKQYDKRWEKLDGDYEPTFKNIYPHFIESFHGFLARILIAEKIREATNWGIRLDYEESFKISDMSHVRNAISILQSFLTAYRSIDHISRTVDCLKHNMSID